MKTTKSKKSVEIIHTVNQKIVAMVNGVKREGKIEQIYYGGKLYSGFFPNPDCRDKNDKRQWPTGWDRFLVPEQIQII